MHLIHILTRNYHNRDGTSLVKYYWESVRSSVCAICVIFLKIYCSTGTNPVQHYSEYIRRLISAISTITRMFIITVSTQIIIKEGKNKSKKLKTKVKNL